MSEGGRDRSGAVPPGNATSEQENNSPNDAFKILMSGKKRARDTKAGDVSPARKRKGIPRTPNACDNRKSRFVLCPAGCGSHVPELAINSHLDGCVGWREERSNEDGRSPNGDRSHPEINESNMAHDGTPNKAGTCPQRIPDDRKHDEASKEAASDHNRNEEPTNRKCSATGDLRAGATNRSVHHANNHSYSKNSPAKKRLECSKDPPSFRSPQNAFSHMMEQSHQVFSGELKRIRLQQRFHLHQDASLTWTDVDDSSMTFAESDEGNVEATQKEGENAVSVNWSSQVTVRTSKIHDKVESDPERELQLTVSSSIPSNSSSVLTTSSPGRSRRLVRRHSRLSVPVLKSMLQKSIRRRRPLPAVRIAMELADKSLGDLIRRLPIIVLEDASLHPDLPLLVWLMVAVSKDYEPPLHIITKVMQIVYEIAACPWKDELLDPSPPVTDNPETQDDPSSAELSSPCSSSRTSPRLLLISPPEIFQEEFSTLPPRVALFIRSMLLRAQYGGMACDVAMIHRYVQLWRERFRHEEAPQEVVNKVLGDRTFTADVSPSSERPLSKCVSPGTTTTCNWWIVPDLLSQNAKQQSTEIIVPLVESKGIDRISITDVCLAGVDFHCSSVLESFVSDKASYESLCEKLGGVLSHDMFSPMEPGDEKGRSLVLGLLKECMWKFSSGVNYRRSLLAAEGEENKSRTEKEEMPQPRDAFLRQVWDGILFSRVNDYAKNYVRERLP